MANLQGFRWTGVAFTDEFHIVQWGYKERRDTPKNKIDLGTYKALGMI